MTKIRIGERLVGDGEPCFVCAEIGINHNGDVELAKRLIDASVLAGCDAVKFQKRTVDMVYAPEELARPRESPFGTTNEDLKRGLELGEDEYRQIDTYCKDRNIIWFASCWDEGSVEFIENFDPPAYKIASASLTDHSLLKYTRSTGKPVILSTGMSTMEQIREAVNVLGADDLLILHCTSTYPSAIEELDLSVIETFRHEFPCPIGYSGHEVGLTTSLAAAVMGASYIERHITLDRAMWGSDQAASVEAHGFHRLVRDIRAFEKARGDGIKKLYESEIPIRRKLRRI